MAYKDHISLALRSILSAPLFFFSFCIYGQLNINAISTPYTVDFDNTIAGVNNGAYAGTGFDPNPAVGLLDSDAFIIDADFGTMNFGDVQTGGAYARGLNIGAGVNTGGIYACGGGSITGRSIGFEPSNSSFTPGRIIMRIRNNTATVIDQIDVQYELHVRNDQGRSTNISFSHSSDNFNYAAEPSADYTSAAAATGSVFFLAGTMNLTLRCIDLQPNDFYYLRWVAVDAGGSGNRDEFGIDNIQVTAVPFSAATYYSRNSGNQTANIGTSTQLWATTPGGVGAVQYPLDPCANYVVQNGDLVTLSASGQPGLTINDLTVEAGGVFVANSATNTYINIRGDITCDGAIGGPANGISFNIENGAHTIAGTGIFDCGRIRKSAVNLTGGTTDLVIDMDLSCHFNGAGIYNNASGPSIMNTTINNGATVDVVRFSIDGATGTDGDDAGGTFTVNGILDISSTMYAYTFNNTINAVNINIGPTGRINAANPRTVNSGTAGTNFNIAAGGVFNITGVTPNDWSLFLPANHTFNFAPGSTVEYSGAGNQRVRSVPTYGNIVFSGGGNKTLNGADLNVVNDLTIVNAAVLVPATYDIYLGGDWTNYAALGFAEGTSTVTFNGAIDQDITCPGADEFYQLVLDKPVNGDVYLIDGINVINNLDLIDGDLYILGKKLSITNNVTSTGITRTNGMLIAEDPTFFGHVVWDVQTNTQVHIMPFGRPDGTYLPMTFQLNSGNAGEVRGSTYPTPPNNLPWPVTPVNVLNLNSWNGLLPDNRDATVDRFWLVGVQNPGVVMDLSLSYAADELPIAPYNTWNTIEAQAYNDVSDEWEPGLPGQIQMALTGAYEVYVPAVAPFTFTPWTFAPTGAPLPIELIDFSATPEGRSVDIFWSTASETNNDLFTLERSSDAVEFQAIGHVPGTGNSTAQIDYQYRDDGPLSGISYYRLKQTDFDGTYTYSEIEAVNMGDLENGTMNVWANANGVQVQHGLSGKVLIVVRDILGRDLYTEVVIDPADRFVLQLPAHIKRNTVLILSMQQNGAVQTARFFY